MTTFSEELLRVRKAHDMTQEQLAAALQTSRSNISHWENGRTLPDLDMARRLSQVLDYNFFSLENSELNAAMADASAPEEPIFPEEAAPAPKPRRVKPWMLFVGAALAAVLSLVLVLALIHWNRSQDTAQVIFVPKEAIVYQQTYADIGRGWKMDLTMRNESDVPFSPEKLLIQFYKGQEEQALMRLTQAQLRQQMESDMLIQGEALAVYNIGTNYPQCDRATATLKGTDANGHALEYFCEITLSHDAAPQAAQ